MHANGDMLFESVIFMKKTIINSCGHNKHMFYLFVITKDIIHKYATNYKNSCTFCCLLLPRSQLFIYFFYL